MNEFVRYYEENKISPVTQDISDINLHLRRRKHLYKMLGINPNSFKNSTILEVGAGSGYNSLVFLLMGANLDIVEPNSKGREDMVGLFDKFKIDKRRYNIYPCLIEDFTSNKRYDYVIAEGFLPAFKRKERQKILQALLRQTKKDTYLVLTTICEFSYFFEFLRVVLGLCLVKNIEDFQDKVQKLSKAFKSHLDALKFASRPIEDWVKDSILNPTNDYFSYSLKKCAKDIQKFSSSCGGGEFEVISMSPNFISNLSWYKDMEYSYMQEIIKRFDDKKYLLLSTSFCEMRVDSKTNQKISKYVIKLRILVKEFRVSLSQEILKEIIVLLQDIINNCYGLGDFFIKSIQECISLLEESNKITEHKISLMPNFSKAWGRGQQYISFVKERE